MARKAPEERVTLTHPSGKYTVTVAPGRVPAMERRGFTQGGKVANKPKGSKATTTAEA
jgi:hypothetical protein